MTRPLQGVKALLYDVFGTVVDWQGSVHRQLEAKVGQQNDDDSDKLDLLTFTKEWRRGYMRRTREIAGGAAGPTNVDALHREILDDLLNEPEWQTLSKWSEQDRQEATMFWHKLDGWTDSSKGMHAVRDLNPPVLQATLSNGSARLLIDVSRQASLPFDAIFSGDIVETYKPDPKFYAYGPRLLDLRPDECAMVAAHIADCRAAKQNGLRAIYVRGRETEDISEDKSQIRAIADGGDVDVIVDNLSEIAMYLQ